jgi:Winged helix DNA-binding domain
MSPQEILNIRLSNQQIAQSNFDNPVEVVRWMGAMQAQDYGMSKLAVGVRLPIATDKQVEAAFNAGKIIRTHVMRPTWHIVAAEDIRWMLELTAPNLDKAADSYFRKLGLDVTFFKKSNALIAQLLQGGNEMTRTEILGALEKQGIVTNGLLIMYKAEIDRIVCNGAMRDKQFTYALFDAKVPPGKPIPRDEAIARLTKRYFLSHAPATLKDFCWWSGLSVGDAKKGLEMVKPDFISETIGTETYYFHTAHANTKNLKDTFRLLPAFDEFLIGYKDRTAAIRLEHQPKAFTKNGIFHPIIVENGQVIGTWKKTIKSKQLEIKTDIFMPFTDNQKVGFEKAVEKMKEYYDLK